MFQKMKKLFPKTRTEESYNLKMMLFLENPEDKEVYQIMKKNEDIKKFEEGIVLDDDYKTKPAILLPLEGNRAEVTISEGKFHQVKRMFADVGKKVLALKRVEFASLSLDAKLSEGEYRHIRPEEMQILDRIMQ